MIIISFFRALILKRRARKLGVPYVKREWYNYRANTTREYADVHGHLLTFYKRRRYITCPAEGENVVYRKYGHFFLYRIIGFQNDDKNRDWRYDCDHIHPVIQFVRALTPDAPELNGFYIESTT